MDRTTGYLISSMRRLQHIRGFAFKNLDIGGTLDDFEGVFYTITSVDNIPLYQSEINPYMTSPQWLPIDWPLTTSFGMPSSNPNLDLPRFVVQCYKRRRNRSVYDASNESFLRAGSCFPTELLVDDSKDILLQSYTLDTRELCPLGFNMFDALSAHSRMTSGSRRDKDVEGDSVAYSLAVAAGFQLDSCPASMLVVILADGHYLTPETYAQLNPTHPSMSLSISSSSSNPGRPEKHDLRRAFDSINRLIFLNRDSQSAIESLNSADTVISKSLSPEIISPVLSDLRREGKENRLRKLREQLSQLAHASEALAAENIQRRAELSVAAATARDSVAILSRAQDIQPIVKHNLVVAKGDADIVRSLSTARQLTLISELFQLYPVLESRGVFSIRGARLPGEREMYSESDEHVSTALGYIVHCIILLAKYLGVPLRYRPIPLGSRSTIRDEVLAHTKDWPLYLKGVERDSLKVGFKMLCRDVKQLLASQGITFSENEHILVNLQRLFNTLLSAPLQER